jgi:hypothetical protein
MHECLNTVCAITRAAGVITGTIVPTFKLGLKRFKIVFFVIKQSFNKIYKLIED